MTPDTARLSIVHYPAAVLKQRAKPIDKIDDTVRAVAKRMIDLMHGEKGLGLAAPQVGLSWRMFVTRFDPDIDEAGGRVYINPFLKVNDPESNVREEGCLSVPGIHIDILRPKAITITATDLDGQPFSMTSDQFIARVWQHENDHLNGVLIIDKMSPMDRLATRKQLKELEAAAKLIGTAKPPTAIAAGSGVVR